MSTATAEEHISLVADPDCMGKLNYGSCAAMADARRELKVAFVDESTQECWDWTKLVYCDVRMRCCDGRIDWVRMTGSSSIEKMNDP